ncbi:hypothetical protein HaLaN_12036, partial [Haematococcus lacustris]
MRINGSGGRRRGQGRHMGFPELSTKHRHVQIRVLDMICPVAARARLAVAAAMSGRRTRRKVGRERLGAGRLVRQLGDDFVEDARLSAESMGGDSTRLDTLLTFWLDARVRAVMGHPRHWPRNSLFGTVFDPLHVILPPFGSTSHNGVASRRDEFVAGGISVPSSLCCRRTGNTRLLPRQARGVVLGCFGDQHQTNTSPRVSQAAVQQGNKLLKTDANNKSPPSPSVSKAAAA